MSRVIRRVNGIEIRYRRVKAGMKQDELGRKLGMTNTTVSRWENERSQPTLYTLRKMAELFGCEVGDLLK